MFGYDSVFGNPLDLYFDPNLLSLANDYLV